MKIAPVSSPDIITLMLFTFTNASYFCWFLVVIPTSAFFLLKSYNFFSNSSFQPFHSYLNFSPFLKLKIISYCSNGEKLRMKASYFYRNVVEVKTLAFFVLFIDIFYMETAWKVVHNFFNCIHKY